LNQLHFGHLSCFTISNIEYAFQLCKKSIDKHQVLVNFWHIPVPLLLTNSGLQIHGLHPTGQSFQPLNLIVNLSQVLDTLSHVVVSSTPRHEWDSNS
jgi:hypothetical protein